MEENKKTQAVGEEGKKVSGWQKHPCTEIRTNPTGKAKTKQTATNQSIKYARHQAHTTPYTLICKYIHEVGAVKNCQGSILGLHNECLQASHIGIWIENSSTAFITSFHYTWQLVCEVESVGTDHRITECYWGLQTKEHQSEFFSRPLFVLKAVYHPARSSDIGQHKRKKKIQCW